MREKQEVLSGEPENREELGVEAERLRDVLAEEDEALRLAVYDEPRRLCPPLESVESVALPGLPVEARVQVVALVASVEPEPVDAGEPRQELAALPCQREPRAMLFGEIQSVHPAEIMARRAPDSFIPARPVWPLSDERDPHGFKSISSRIRSATARIMSGGTERPSRSHCCA